MTIQEQIALLRKREDTCWDMFEIFLAARDKAVAECPVNNPPARIPPNCPVCTSTAGEPCWATMRADNRFVDAIRALLSGSQLTKEKP